LQPGWVGGVLLFFISLLYIPNAIIATLSYLPGPGFAVGVGTSISALTHRVAEIPALPLLGALPTGRHPLALLSGVGIAIGGAVIYTVAMRRRNSTFVFSSVVIFASFALLAYLSSGELLTQALGTVGVSIWRFTLALFVEFTGGALLAWFGPWLIGRIRIRSKGVEA